MISSVVICTQYSVFALFCFSVLSPRETCISGLCFPSVYELLSIEPCGRAIPSQRCGSICAGVDHTFFPLWYWCSTVSE